MALLRNWKKNLLTILLFVLVYGGIRAYQLSGYRQGVAPSFSATNLQGQTINLSDFRGKPVLIYFWATWCPVCKLERSSIESLAEDHQVIAIASWSNDAQAVRQYFHNPKLQHSTIDDNSQQLANLYGVSGVPSFFFLDKNGDIRFIERGYTTPIGLRLRLFLAGLR